MESELTECRLCQYTSLVEILNLGTQVITSRFPVKGDTSTPTTRIRLVMCEKCQLVQLKDTTSSSELYEHLYGYRSGISQTMRTHLKEYYDEICTYVTLHENDHVLDIGSNDSTMLQNYPSMIQRVGCDPTGSQFKQYYGDVQLIETYFTKDAIHSRFSPTTRFKIVSSISMFYDLPRPVQFAKDIYDILDDNGIWTLEQSYVKTMLEKNSIDTICHEHLEYYGVKQIKEIMDRAGFKIINLSTNNCNGGSFRIYVAKKCSDKYEECTEKIIRFIDEENALQIHTPKRYIQFMNDCQHQVDLLKGFIHHINQNHKKVYIYGASTKGNCLLQFGNLDSTHIPYAVERNPLKYGRTTSTGIEIISEEEMRANPPEYLLVLPWHFRNEIVERESEFLSNGGSFIFPFPTFEIYTSKPRCIITGINGQIGHYVYHNMKSSYHVYGITHPSNTNNTSINQSSSVHTISIDISDKKALENIIMSIKPSSIIHLASISHTEQCESQPIDTILTNGMSVSYICDIIYRNKLTCNLFNASSSEVYAGHMEYNVSDNDKNHKPYNIYSISKSFGHQVVDYYRNRYQLLFSNGIIFTTESSHRKPLFLLKKASEHAKQWSDTHNVLSLGPLDSFRNIIHAQDVADAICVIVYQPTGGSYVICQTEPMIMMSDVILGIYQNHNIILKQRDDTWYDETTGLDVIHTTNSMTGRVASKINGYPDELLKLGWKPRFTINDIIDELTK